ncbi:DGQHR domain-containing protein [Mucilaginibacter sp. OK268]|uniref:DGQHR domain-containing protein n=1 Tax=Mucilaginibacter sp. OK268 TaxID=1881048 RepID=UPI000882BE58|nr:DGQHR domain-containing protein [Mucilaginibacter sp. OK268]SDP45880.1 DGQHR domain-containing protein [Mucilaginibacter sp. OK268]
METKIINLNNRDYLKVQLLKVTQKSKSFYLATINATNFLEVFTVRPAQYDLDKHSSLANSFEQDDKYYSHLINDDKLNINEKDFQRNPNDDRINQIVSFLKNEEFAFFPNTIIANCELINDWESFDINENSTEEDFAKLEDKPAFLSFLCNHNDNYFLYIPYVKNSVLVIDGQHRLVGLEKSDVSIQQGFDLIIAFIIGLDRSIIAKQFYTINYEQKPVNKSLLYQLTGEFTREIDELSFMHNVTKLLNELDGSPFKGRIKMLGITPKGLSAEVKSRLSISQAFFIDSTIRFISAKAKGSFYEPIFLKYFKNTDNHINIVRVISRFFNAVSELKPEWNVPSESIISKGMGVGALLKTLNLLFLKIFKDEMKEDWAKVDLLNVELFKRVLIGIGDVDFTNTGPYGKTGSAGSISKIHNDILSKLEYLGKPQNTTQFIEQYKAQYWVTFDAKLNVI